MSWQFGAAPYVAVVCLALSACSGGTHPQTQLSHCSELAQRAALDEACAIEIAKQEITKRQGKLDYSRFSARFHEPDGVWIVEAVREPEIPGGYVSLFVSKSGEVTSYMPGM